jgi:YD repeat-containing protein
MLYNFYGSLTVHSSGDLYFADNGNSRIRKIDQNGIITTVAGGGSSCQDYWRDGGGGGDGGPAVEACLATPVKAAFDVSGNMYIVDAADGRIRKVDTTGIITTVASGLDYPGTVAVDPSGNIYFAEWMGLKKIDPSGTMTTLIEDVQYIFDLALDSAGNLYMSDYYTNPIVVKMDTNGRKTIVAGIIANGYSGDGGPATQARLGRIGQIAIDRAGNLYIADSENGSVRKVDSHGIITTVAGNGTLGNGVDGKPATQTPLYHPKRLAVGIDGSLYVSEWEKHRIRKISQPAGFIVWDLNGEIPFAEENGLGHIFSSAGRHLKTVDLETGRDLYTFDYDADGRVVFVRDRFGNPTAIERDAAGRPFAVVSPPTACGRH